MFHGGDMKVKTKKEEAGGGDEGGGGEQAGWG